MEALYIEAMDELLAKDLRSFTNNLRRVADQARARLRAPLRGRLRRAVRSQSSANLLPLVFVGVVLWSVLAVLICRCSGMLAPTLADRVPAHPPAAEARRRPRSRVERRSPATWPTRLPTRRPCAPSRASRTRRGSTPRNVRDFGAKTLRSWDYQNLRIDMITSPMFVLTNTLGLVVALGDDARYAARASKPCSSPSATTRRPRASCGSSTASTATSRAR